MRVAPDESPTQHESTDNNGGFFQFAIDLLCLLMLIKHAHTLVKKYHPPLLETGDTSASKETCRFNG